MARGGMHGKEGACVVKGGVHGEGGVCGEGGHAWYVWPVIARAVRILLECILVMAALHVKTKSTVCQAKSC